MTAPDPQRHIAMLERELAWAYLKIQALAEELRQERILKYGPRSETLSTLQLGLLDQEPGVSRDEVEAEARREPIAESKPDSHHPPHPGRQRLPEHLPRVEEVIACEERNCKACGAETAVIGYDESEQLDVEPARYFVRVTKREKRVCRRCVPSTVTAAVLPERIVEKGLASDRVVIATVVAKYSDHLPLYRQAAMLEREAGVEISRATLDGWVMRVGELLSPVVEAMRQYLLGASYLQADETTVPVQMHDKRGADHPAYLWQYGKPGGETVFEFCLGRGREGPRKFLGKWEGILQTDGYQAYDGIGGPKMVHVGCWTHARRKVCRRGESESARRRGGTNGAPYRGVVPGGSSRATTAHERGRSLGSAARTRRIVGGRDSPGVRGGCENGVAKERAGAGRVVHIKYVDETATLFRLRRSGAVEQSGGELDASDRVGPQELVARGSRAGRAESRRDPFGWWNRAAESACP
jgi:transposase